MKPRCFRRIEKDCNSSNRLPKALGQQFDRNQQGALTNEDFRHPERASDKELSRENGKRRAYDNLHYVPAQAA